MRRSKAVLMLLFFALALGGCGAEEAFPPNDPISGQLFQPLEPVTPAPQLRVGLYISYIDLAQMDLSPAGQKAAADAILQNAQQLGCTDVFLQLRAFGDSLYSSAVYPSMTQTVLPPDADGEGFVRQLLDTLHASEIRVHGWVNPYRLYARGDAAALYPALADALVSWESGLYLRPDSEIAKQQILSGISEVLQLGFDGIHFDDYFYPTTEPAFDAAAFAAYQEGGGALTLEDWRRDAVNDLVKRSYALVKQAGEEKIFSISPDGSISRNRETHFADVALWCAEAGYLDWICPQLYYGFQNQALPFQPTLREWKALCKNAQLMPVLSAYKIGTEDSWAGSGSAEWQTEQSILARQYQAAQKEGCIGVSLYRYGSLFAPAEQCAAAVMQEIDDFLEVREG